MDGKSISKTAEQMGQQGRVISISEFFEKNRHLLGYDNKIKALLIIVKEGVDNGLDATEEAKIIPDIYVKVEEIGKETFRIVIRDNGPGIVKAQIPKIFGSLLYGSKFHRLKQSRGQQGLGISCAVMYSQLTTGQPTEVVSSTGTGKQVRYKIKIDVKKNTAIILSEKEEEARDNWHGVQITFQCEGIYREHRQSILEYIKQTAISNPYSTIVFDAPTGKKLFKRGVDVLPKEPKEIKPHLEGVEVGIFERMLEATTARSISSFLTTEFTRIGKTTATDICEKAKIDPKTSPRRIHGDDIRRIIATVKEVRLTKPPTDVLSPLGQELIENGLVKELNPEFVTAISRPPAVYRGWPFQIEVGLAYGGSIQEPKVMRFANRVPLLYQQGDCAITKSVMGIDWRRYGIESEKLPTGPFAIFVHICSVWVPFTSESKEAVASYPIIIKETKLAIQEAARKLSLYLSGKKKAEYQKERMAIFERYSGETAHALEELTGEKSDGIKKLIDEIVLTVKPEEIEGQQQDEQPQKPQEQKPREKKPEEVSDEEG